ncbi:hypothetical protein EON82_07785 [bacterium]|nr:MAG: hypothetical protein EON82_07785 [bacterium]
MYDGADPPSFDSEDVRRAMWVEDPGYEVSAIQLATYHAIATRSPDAAELADSFVEKCEKAYDEASDEEERTG